MISVRRVYAEPEKGTFQILVDRIWPRGISKEKARIDVWFKEIAPSDELRKWFSHDPSKWEEFKRRYFKELDVNPARSVFISLLKNNKKVALVFSAKDELKNQAIALKEYLENRGL